MKTPSHLKAILLALLVTFLWSTSFILIKWGLTEIPPLTYAGLRYSLAFLCLLPFAFTKNNKTAIKTLKKNEWLKLSLYGLLFIAFTQGAMFMGLQLLPAVTVSLWLNFTPIVVAVTAIFFLRLLWLAIINTAVAFVIWNYTLRTLTAMESSIINGTMLIQIAVLAWIFLGEGIGLQEIMGMAAAAVGAVLVQLRKRTVQN